VGARWSAVGYTTVVVATRARRARREPGPAGGTPWARSDGWRALGDVDEVHVLRVVSNYARRNRDFARCHCCPLVAACCSCSWSKFRLVAACCSCSWSKFRLVA
jgi:hypothetical protein